jgi:hypothetical protein
MRLMWIRVGEGKMTSLDDSMAITRFMKKEKTTM